MGFATTKWALSWVLVGGLGGHWGVGAETLLIRPDGPNAERLGMKQAYPACPQALTRPECRVGTWSANDTVAPSAVVRPAGEPMPLPHWQDAPAISYRWGLFSKTLDDFMAETQTTGLMVIQDGRVVAERYQYGRQPDMRFRSFSMAKTFTAMLVGIAHGKGLIRSLDDKAADYWPEIAPSAYGQTTIRNLLRMSSGVPFRELYTWTPDDDIWLWGRVLYSPENRRRPEKIVEYLNTKTTREAEQGVRFKYATIETEILGRVLSRAAGMSITQMTEDWLWKPMGAEAQARWLLASTDQGEGTGGSFNATLRDYARFGVLLANDGVRGGVQVIPRDYLLDATDAARQPGAFRPRSATPGMGYGYQTWIAPFNERTFALQGIHGQHIMVQPKSGIVMVQTSVNEQPSGRQDPRPYQMRDALWLGVLKSLGGVTD
ncbi:serine hydrolase [Limnohabitans sp. Bal53]|uniref:serine hydrolase domain-containing protein n=1 Tax=Limnohabitans sp. Bal53 TaxID=1977910 RepID=UPI001304FC40|nr:serine hydrolase [Limnohabitans sp. Bal53]